jgi:hypothetical protein
MNMQDGSTQRGSFLKDEATRFDCLPRLDALLISRRPTQAQGQSEERALEEQPTGSWKEGQLA